MMASRKGHLDCVKELLEKGALVNAQNTVSAVCGCMGDPICISDMMRKALCLMSGRGMVLCNEDMIVCSDV